MRSRSFLMALLSAGLFGIATPFSKSLLHGIQENQLAGLLYLGAAIFLLPYMAGQWKSGKATLPKSTRNRLMLLGAIFFGGITGPVLLLFGLRFSQAASVSMWLNLETVATAVLAALFFREHLGKWTWIGNAGVLCAGFLLSFEHGWAGFMGIALVGGAAISWGMDNNLTATIDGITPQATTFWKGLVAGLTNLLIGLWLSPAIVDTRWGWALLLGSMAYGASIVLYISSAQTIGAARSQMIFSSSPFFGILLSILWLGESMTFWQLGALGVLIAALICLLIDQHSHQHHHHAAAHIHDHRHDDMHHTHSHDEICGNVRHSHEHHHAPHEHAHPHWPDLHHRHDH